MSAHTINIKRGVNMKKVISILLCVLMLNNLSVAAAGATVPTIKSAAAVLYDLNGNKLVDINGDERLSPASVTKVMTMLLIMEAIDKGNLAYEDMVTTSAYASSMGGTQVYLKENEQMSVHDMLKAITVASANDASVAMAEHIAGSEEAFVSMMNNRAKELGMDGTTFVNANGLDMNGAVTLTTANDIATMSVELLKHPKIRDYTTIWMDSLRGGEFELANTNKMLKNYPGCFGIKTGYTGEAKYSISVGAERDGMGFIAVIMKAETKEDRTADAISLLNYGFANYKKVNIKIDEPLEAKVSGGVIDTVYGAEIENQYLVVPIDKAGDIKTEVIMKQGIMAPVKAGDIIGEVLIKSGDEVIHQIDIIAKDDIKKMTYFDIYIRLFKVLFMQM